MGNFLVIGASSGIGRQLALQLASAGHRVFGTYFRNVVLHSEPEVQPGAPATETVAPPAVEYHHLDVLGQELNLGFLPDSLDGMVYCPGSISLKPFHRISPDAFRADYELQVVGAVKTIQAVLPRLKKSDQASIVLFSTVAVQTGFNFHSLVSASKGAIEGLTRALAAEFAPTIRVNAIAPSLTDTPLAAPLLNSEQKLEANAQRHPMKRVGKTGDIASMAEFLLTGKSSWITGQVFHVDGGISSLRV